MIWARDPLLRAEPMTANPGAAPDGNRALRACRTVSLQGVERRAGWLLYFGRNGEYNEKIYLSLSYCDCL
jgi:hypothetical protein